MLIVLFRWYPSRAVMKLLAASRLFSCNTRPQFPGPAVPGSGDRMQMRRGTGRAKKRVFLLAPQPF